MFPQLYWIFWHFFYFFVLLIVKLMFQIILTFIIKIIEILFTFIYWPSFFYEFCLCSFSLRIKCYFCFVIYFTARVLHLSFFPPAITLLTLTPPERKGRNYKKIKAKRPPFSGTVAGCYWWPLSVASNWWWQFWRALV